MVTFLNADMLLSCVETAGNPECQGVGWGDYQNSQFLFCPKPTPPPPPSRERGAPLHSLQSTTSSYYYVAYYYFYP